MYLPGVLPLKRTRCGLVGLVGCFGLRAEYAITVVERSKSVVLCFSCLGSAYFASCSPQPLMQNAQPCAESTANSKIVSPTVSALFREISGCSTSSISIAVELEFYLFRKQQVRQS